MTVHQERAHAKLSPSAAHRWINCPGSIRESEGVPNVSSKFAEEGTAAHTLAEECLRVGADASHFAGDHVNLTLGGIGKLDPDGTSFEVTEEMADAVQVYLDTVREIAFAHPDIEFEVEAQLDMRDVPGMAFGTGDFCAYDPAQKKLTIIDYKHGRGVPVEANANPQLFAYAIGTAKRYHNRGLSEIELIVVQPRCPHPDGPVRRYICPAIELLDFETDLAEAALRTMQPDAPLLPGEWCKFCPAAFKCPALREFSLEAASAAFASEGEEIFTSTPPVEPEHLDADALREALDKAGMIKVWIAAVEAHAHHEATHGRCPTGYKLVAKRALRRWKDEAAAKEFLGGTFTPDQYMPRYLVSPAEADKLLKKNKAALKPFVEAKSSGTVLAEMDDPRPAVGGDASGFNEEGTADV